MNSEESNLYGGRFDRLTPVRKLTACRLDDGIRFPTGKNSLSPLCAERLGVLLFLLIIPHRVLFSWRCNCVTVMQISYWYEIPSTAVPPSSGLYGGGQWRQL
jgi:hypothetical protein